MNMEKVKSLHQQVAEIETGCNEYRKQLSGIIGTIFDRHDKNQIAIMHSSAPVVYVDEVNCSAYTVDMLSYEPTSKVLWIDCSDSDSNTTITDRSIELDLLVMFVKWLVENEDPIFAGVFSEDTDYEEYNEDDDDLPF